MKQENICDYDTVVIEIKLKHNGNQRTVIPYPERHRSLQMHFYHILFMDKFFISQTFYITLSMFRDHTVIVQISFYSDLSLYSMYYYHGYLWFP